jgi:hypothetical protein
MGSDGRGLRWWEEGSSGGLRVGRVEKECDGCKWWWGAKLPSRPPYGDDGSWELRLRLGKVVLLLLLLLALEDGETRMSLKEWARSCWSCWLPRRGLS